MRVGSAAILGLCAVVGLATTALAQATRQDAIWARRTGSTITLNGILNEPAWAKAESITIQWANDAGIPGSGWKVEGGTLPVDPTYATLKFLVSGNQLYMGAKVRDQSVGGSKDFNRFDGFLMDLKDHNNANFPKPPAEYLYSWWYPKMGVPPPPGQQPSFKGVWGPDSVGAPRTPEQIANWDAVTVVNGLSNDDAANDVSYTVEMRFNVAAMGYDVTRPEGDVLEWNISIYDCDWLWPLQPTKLSYNRVWWQDPWGYDMWYGEVRLFARPDVTTSSTNPLPPLRPEVYIPNGAAFAAPTIDGNLTEPVWSSAYTFDIRYGDTALRASYPWVGKYRSGQYQPPVNGGQAQIIDPADATVKMFFRDNKLYVGFDVRDQAVQYHSRFDRWDGAIVSLNERVLRNPDNALMGRRLSFQVAQNGTALAQDYLLTLVQATQAEVALTLKAGTTVDTTGTDTDTGYDAEMAVDLTALGYPSGLGDGTMFVGVDLLDGDSSPNPADSYGTRTWWFREWENKCCPAWAYLAPSPPTAIGDPQERQTEGFVLLGAAPNPGLRSLIRYSLARPTNVNFELFDVRGRLVEKHFLGVQPAGVRETGFDGTGYPAGIYMYRLKLTDPATGAARPTLRGRVVVVK